MKTLEEKNRMIAEFMGGKKDAYGSYDLYSVAELTKTFEEVDAEDPHAIHFYHPAQMRFNSSWEWLIPVISKIVNMSVKHEDFSKMLNYVEQGLLYGGVSDITKPYKRVVEFIEWYNENK